MKDMYSGLKGCFQGNYLGLCSGEDGLGLFKRGIISDNSIMGKEQS